MSHPSKECKRARRITEIQTQKIKVEKTSTIHQEQVRKKKKVLNYTMKTVSDNRKKNDTAQAMMSEICIAESETEKGDQQWQPKSDITYDNKYIYGQKTCTNCPSQDMCPGKNAREKTNNNENADSQAELSESNKSMFERERERERERCTVHVHPSQKNTAIFLY